MTAEPVLPEAPPQRRRARAELLGRPPDHLPESPYKGLSYYEQPDAPFFFGREQETQIVAANLMASRLTVLYGESGVGKSSLLRAGAVRHLMEIARENVERRGKPRLVVAVFPHDDGAVRTTWRDDPIPAILGAIQRAVASLGLDIPSPPPGPDLCAQLAAWTERLGSDLVIILDQFEEYLLYHEGDDGPGTLAVELPRAVLMTNLRVNFLVSIREDMLAKLDSFKRRIPTIFDNCVRIRHLDRDHARAAIEKPIDKYNELSGAAKPIKIEPPLVDTLLAELEAGRFVVGLSGAGTSADGLRASEQAIETPYLQLVMARLWKEEAKLGSSVLRLATLERLGHSERIVKTHLDETMRTLPRYARYIAARAFHHLVTPSGSKIAHSPTDLAAYVGLDEQDIEPVLERLTEPEYRILRRVALATAEDAPARFEIFHDVLGTPILDWRARYLRGRGVANFLRRGLTALVLSQIGIWALFAVPSMAASFAGGTWMDKLWLAWMIGGLLIWVSTMIVLVERWHRREVWAVPYVGLVAAAIAPLTALTLAAYAATRAWSVVWRRLTRAPARAPAQPRTTSSVRRLSGVVAMVGAGVIVLACLLPAVTFEASAKTAPFELQESSESLIGAGGRSWLALPPLMCAALAFVAGMLALTRPRPRRFVMGVLTGLGIGAMAYFVSVGSWDEALSPYSGYDARTHNVYEKSEEGPYLGLGGAGLVLVAAAPLVIVEVFASIIGAGRFARGRTRELFSMELDRAGSHTRLPVGLLGAVGAAAAIMATLAESSAWGRPPEKTLFDVSEWAALPVVTMATVAMTAAAVIVFSRRVSERAAGCLAGCGLALLAFFLGVFGSLDWQAPAGAYLGAGAGAVLAVAGILGFAARPRRRSSMGGATRRVVAEG